MPPSAGYLDDLHSFDPATMAWTLLSAAADSAPAPSARYWHGFTSAGGKLYVHGGIDSALMHKVDYNRIGNASHGECVLGSVLWAIP